MTLSAYHPSYQQLGEKGESYPLILLHGLFGMSDNLMPLARKLSEKYCIYVMDLRNHGRSPHVKSMTWREMAGDVIYLMDSLNLDKAGVLGHSLGGKVAMSLAGIYPQRVASLVVADIAPVEYRPQHQAVLAGLQAIDLENIGSRQQVIDQLGEFIADSGVRQFLAKNIYKKSQGEYAWRFNLTGLLENYDLLRTAPEMELPYQGSTLFIKGETSHYIVPEYQAAIKKAFPHFQFKMIQGAGHWLHAEKPVAFAKVVEKYFDTTLS